MLLGWLGPLKVFDATKPCAGLLSFGGPENPWGWASRVAAESASSRPIDPAPARARVQHASVKKEMTRSIVDGVADLSRRSAKSPEKSTEIGGAHLRRTLPCSAVCVPPLCQSQGPTSAAQSGRAAWFWGDVTAWRTSRRTTFDSSDMVPSRVMRYSVMRLNPAARATKDMLGARLPIRSFGHENWMNRSTRMISASLRIGPYARAIGAQASHSCPISYWARMRLEGIYAAPWPVRRHSPTSQVST